MSRYCGPDGQWVDDTEYRRALPTPTAPRVRSAEELPTTFHDPRKGRPRKRREQVVENEKGATRN